MKNKLTTERTENIMIVRRTFDAPRELVFDVHTDCNHLKKWYGGEQWPLVKCEMNFMIGGIWKYCFSDPDGGEMCAKAEYRVIKRPEKITYFEHFLDDNGDMNSNFPAGLITYDFIDKNGNTEIINRWEYPSEKDMDWMVENGAVEGLTEIWHRLEKYLSIVQKIE